MRKPSMRAWMRPWMKMCAGILLAPLLAAAAARAEIVELNGGRMVQGRILESQSTDDGGLAVELFDTGGVIMVRWDHILPARKTELRVKMGFESPETEDELLVPGHRILLSSNLWIEGKLLNPDEKDKPAQLKTARSVQSIDRPTIQRVDEAQLPARFVYTPDELYQMERDRAAPDSPAAHFELASYAMRVGALGKAKEHLDAARDPAFLASSEGRKIPQFERKLDLLIKCEGANDIKVQIEAAIRSKRWNDALAFVNQIDKTYTDEAVRREIRFDLLQHRVVIGRQTFFRRQVQSSIYQTMRKLIEAKAREKKQISQPGDAPRGAAPGTLAAARQWMNKDLPKQMWDKVQADLGLTAEEMDAYWKDRSGKSPQMASYGWGSFVYVKKPAAAGGKAGEGPQRPRRPSGSDRGQQGGPPRQVKESKPKTDEEWWEDAGTSERKGWMEAYFAEFCGIMTVIRVDESEMCDSCGGKGVKSTDNSDGTTSTSVCPRCNQAGKVRRVYYR